METSQSVPPTVLSDDAPSPERAGDLATTDSDLLRSILARLTHIEEKLDAVTPAAEAARAAMEVAPSFIATLTDIVDEQTEALVSRGIDPEVRIRRLMMLAERLTDPQMMDLAEQLLDRSHKLRTTLELLDQMPGFIATIVDVVDEIAQRALEEGLDLEKGALQGAKAALQFGSFIGPSQLSSIEALLDSGVLDPAALSVIGSAGQALAGSTNGAVTEIGPVGLLRAMRDPDIQRAIGFLVTFGKQFGSALSGASRTTRPVS